MSKPLMDGEKLDRNPGLNRALRSICLATLFLAGAAPAQERAAPAAAPPPQTLAEVLRRLHTTARLLHTTAHPDDEDGGMLTLESRGKGDEVMLLTLNRGEGGQNKVGSNLFDELGVLRTLELLASDGYYGVEQRFTRVADFGYSKSAEESFQKWHGHDIALADMVRVIRTFRPDVIVSRFQGSARDGHGHHEAAGILTPEAFHAAADPNRFPEQIREGLRPWQAKKLYCDNVRANEDPTIKLNTGAEDPLLGDSYAHLAMQGLKHQLSQGAGAWQLDPGPHYSYYRLLESVLPGPKPQHEEDFFDGINTTLVGLADRAGSEEVKIPRLRSRLGEIASDIDKATASQKNPAQTVDPLLHAAKLLEKLLQDVENEISNSSSGERPVWFDLLPNLFSKRDQLREAINLAAGVKLEVVSRSALVSTAPPPLVPGESFHFSVRITNHGVKIIQPERIDIDLAGDGDRRDKQEHKSYKPIAQGHDVTIDFERAVPEDAAYTRPYFHRSDPETETVYTIDNPRYLGWPLPPPAFTAHVTYSMDGVENVIGSPAEVEHKTPDGSEASAPLAIAPRFSVLINPATEVVPLNSGSKTPAQITVTASSNVLAPANTKLRIEAPSGWRVQPESQDAIFAKAGEAHDYHFQLYPSSTREGQYQIRASLDYMGKHYGEGYSVVSRPDLGTAYYYQPATQRVSLVDIKVPSGLSVGYIMGAGDDIPAILGQLGIEVTLITPEELTSGDLGRYRTIITGIRAYDTREDLRKNNQRLLDYVSNGGTLMVQYNSGIADFNSAHFMPFPAELSRDRVSVEESPVQVLQPDDSIFHRPNPITARDFDGWVQERGLDFMKSWDSHYQPLLSCHDPGEAPMAGGLLLAHYGKGTYIYNAYAFFRQLPNGVPGAVRLYVNLISASQSTAPVQNNAQK